MRTPHNESVSPDTSDSRHITGQARSSAPQKSCPKQIGPERKCILSGDVRPQDELVRLAISPDGPDGVAQVMPDLLARAPGRGAWLGVTRTDLETAIAKGTLRGALARAFKGAKLAVPDDLPDLIENGLTRLLLDRLGIENRGGSVITGSDRIAEKARGGRVTLLLHASDASEGGSGKLDQAWRVGNEIEGSGQRGLRLPLDRAALSVALGRDNVVHLGVAGEAASGRVNTILQRLLHFTGAEPVQGEPRNRPAETTN